MVQEFEAWFDNEPTIVCGPNGCDSCRKAYHRSCAPIIPGPLLQISEPSAPETLDGVVHVDPEWESDTALDIKPNGLNDDPELEYDAEVYVDPPGGEA